MMNILVYVEPWIERGKPDWRKHWLNVLVPMFENLVNDNKNVKFSIKFLVGDSLFFNKEQLRRMQNIKHASVSYITQMDLRQVCPNYIDATVKQYLDTFTDEELEVMCKNCKKAIGSFRPDLIFTFMSQVPFLKKLFPGVPVLHQEVGMISRNPYPTTYYLDPFGTFSNGYIGKFKKELSLLKLNNMKEDFLKSFRRIFVENGIRRNQQFTRQELLGGKKFKKLVLLPLQIDPYFSFNAHVDFKDQFDFICYVLDRIDKNVGVVVTTHSDWDNCLAREGALDYLKSAYPNFIFMDKFYKVRYASQYLLDLVDGIISVSSTVGLQAMIFKKPLFVVGTNKQLLNICESDKIEDIGRILARDKYTNRDAILYHLLTHYYILHEPYSKNGEWLYKFFLRTIKYNKENRQFDFFDKVDSDEILIQHFEDLNNMSVNNKNGDRMTQVAELVYLIKTNKKTIKYKIAKLLKTKSYKKFKEIERYIKTLK